MPDKSAIKAGVDQYLDLSELSRHGPLVGTPRNDHILAGIISVSQCPRTSDLAIIAPMSHDLATGILALVNTLSSRKSVRTDGYGFGHTHYT